MSLDYGDSPEKYVFVAMFGALIAAHSALLVHHAQQGIALAGLIYGQGGFIAFLAAITVWMIRTPW